MTVEPEKVDPGAGLTMTAGPEPGLEVGVGVGLGVIVAVAVGLRVGVGVGVVVGVAVGVGLGATVGVGVTLGFGVAVGLGVGLGLNPKPKAALFGRATASNTTSAQLAQGVTPSLKRLMRIGSESRRIRPHGVIIWLQKFLRLSRSSQSGEAVARSRAGN